MATNAKKSWKNILASGNQSFRQSPPPGYSSEIRERLAGGQSPTVAVVACADSRVPVEHIFNASLGELFVVRVAGNVIDPVAVASLEFAYAALGVKAILVMGHSKCGAVAAACSADDPETPCLQHLVQTIRPGIAHTDSVEEAVAANVEYQVKRLKEQSTLLAEAIDAGNLEVVGSVYDLASGAVHEPQQQAVNFAGEELRI